MLWGVQTLGRDGDRQDLLCFRNPFLSVADTPRTKPRVAAVCRPWWRGRPHP